MEAMRRGPGLLYHHRNAVSEFLGATASNSTGSRYSELARNSLCSKTGLVRLVSILLHEEWARITLDWASRVSLTESTFVILCYRQPARSLVFPDRPESPVTPQAMDDQTPIRSPTQGGIHGIHGQDPELLGLQRGFHVHRGRAGVLRHQGLCK